MIRRTWTYVSNNALLAGIISGMALLALGTWRWSDVKALVVGAGAWLMGTTEVYRVVMLVDFLVLAAVLAWAALWWSRGRASGTRVVVSVVTPEGVVVPKATPVKFEPEKFQLTPPRCRALLTLLHRVDAKTTLHDLYTQVMGGVATAVVKPISKGELQHDMDEAERLGLVSIDRVGQYTQYYNLTTPKGRDWVLSKEDEVRVEGAKGLIRRDPRAPGR